MDEENKDGQEVHETPETEETTDEVETLTPEEIADLKKRAEVSSQNFERAKKAEEELKKVRQTPTETQAISPKDMLALSEHQVSSADYDEVVRVAAVLNKPIHEALQDPLVKTILQKNAEERRSAETAHTRTSARGSSKATPQDLLRKAETTGEVPETDDGMRELAKARLMGK